MTETLQGSSLLGHEQSELEALGVEPDQGENGCLGSDPKALDLQTRGDPEVSVDLRRRWHGN